MPRSRARHPSAAHYLSITSTAAQSAHLSTRPACHCTAMTRPPSCHCTAMTRPPPRWQLWQAPGVTPTPDPATEMASARGHTNPRPRGPSPGLYSDCVLPAGMRTTWPPSFWSPSFLRLLCSRRHHTSEFDICALGGTCHLAAIRNSVQASVFSRPGDLALAVHNEV